MNVIKSLGARFNKLWRWIKETAWVQPLLIVGAIFAIIFSIPKFSSWFEAMGIGSSNSFYNSHKLSLEGEAKDADPKDYSEADKLTAAIQKYSFGQGVSPSIQYSESEIVKAVKADELIAKRGEKFFLVYVSTSCTACDEAQPGFENLEKYWNTTYAINDGRSFKIHTIYADDTSSNDEDFTLSDDKKAFYRYLNNFTDFWEDAAGRLVDAPYKTNASISESYYNNIETVNCASWQVPTIFLIDFSEDAWAAGRFGISEACFGVSGSSSIEKAQLLQKMWNHLPTYEWKDGAYGIVESSKDSANIFRAEYQKN